MNNKAMLKENLNNEFKSFRRSFERMEPKDVYDSFYKINFYEEYYALLSSDFIDNYDLLVDWLSKHSYPLAFLYNEWLSCDGAFSGDWDDMIDFMTTVYEEEE